MKEIVISSGEAGQRFDKFLEKYLRNASRSFLYKNIRKKNITLNGKKAEGSELLNTGDNIKIFFSDETFEKFRGNSKSDGNIKPVNLDIIYEDEDVIFINKPAGMLSQKGKDEDVSLCEYIFSYLINSGKLDDNKLRAFSPSVCNRLDRNTSGLITAGKTLKGLQTLSKVFRDRDVDKYYLAIVKGEIRENIAFDGYLFKDEASNKVELSDKSIAGSEKISTQIYPVQTNNGYSLIKVKLLTGKTHQIRATLLELGYPIVGDKKYGACDLSLCRRQLLHSYELIFKDGKKFKASLPEDFKRVMIKLGLEE